jgi:hypothetical protein
MKVFAFPHLQKFLAMQLCLFRNEAPYSGRQGTIKNSAFFDRDNRTKVVIPHVKVGRVVFVKIHADNHSEESAYFRHGKRY